MPDKGQQHSIEKSRQLQRNLYLAANKNKQRRFHALYDRIYRLDILWRAWKEVRINKGSAGIDGITFEMIEEYGVEEYLFDIQQDLVNGKYKPLPVKRVYIPKPDGKQRPLGIKQYGVNEWKAWEYANTRKGYWRISNSPILSKSLDNQTLSNLGFIYFSDYYSKVCVN
ncbi:hypothetical protein acsn021_44030 [Anaerocolumna cellulosilytica]|uniref:Uncharacterized protein n=1 Tax=Anaerocolumna cellulosilytica TaxID=433286 RepID=A0A6S6R1P8_9FIRM|nr:hypothetical protein [Anaerocolumna cellulosilytica]MBB5195824.1 hypothetical protein [Anaerocolumna cellulosilytica]BCJ96834.1 hypothetical protein acsn021_44030 [Anaerocolumna cellulosilytica]